MAGAARVAAGRQRRPNSIAGVPSGGHGSVAIAGVETRAPASDGVRFWIPSAMSARTGYGDGRPASGVVSSQVGGGREAPLPRAIEGHAAIPERDPRVVADHQVVEDIDVEQAAGGDRLGGEVQVVG